MSLAQEVGADKLFSLTHFVRGQTSHHSTTRFPRTKQQTIIMQTKPYLVRQKPSGLYHPFFLSHQCFYCIRFRRTGHSSMGPSSTVASPSRLKYKINEHYRCHSSTSKCFLLFFFFFKFLSSRLSRSLAWVEHQ